MASAVAWSVSSSNARRSAMRRARCSAVRPRDPADLGLLLGCGFRAWSCVSRCGLVRVGSSGFGCGRRTGPEGLSGGLAWLFPGWRTRPRLSGQGPGVVVPGQAEVDQALQVDRGGPAGQPGVVLGHCAVAQLPVAAGQPGQGPLDQRPFRPVGVLEAGVLSSGALGA